MTDDYYGPERASEKMRAAEWLFGIALAVLAVMGTLAVLSLGA